MVAYEVAKLIHTACPARVYVPGDMGELEAGALLLKLYR